MAGSGGESGITQVVTLTPQGTQPRWLGTLGHVTPAVYSDTLPGGPDQLTCTLEREATYRTDAMTPGHLVRAYRGGSSVWNGTLLEPVWGSGGWAIVANGAGNWGASYNAVYSNWNNQNDAVDQAIARGLPWVNGHIPSGVWLGQPFDSGSQTIKDLLTLYCTKGGYTWHVGRGNVLSVYPWSTSPVTRILTCKTPVARTLGGDVNVIHGRYQTSSSSATTATYGLTAATVPASILAHGRQEIYDDLSNAGQMSGSAVVALLSAVLAKYQRVNFAGPFVVQHGEYLNAGGYPVDLGCEHAGEVVRLIMTDAGYGGEVVPGPVTFVVGRTDYDDRTGTLTVTPYQSLDLSMSSLLSVMGMGLVPPAAKPVPAPAPSPAPAPGRAGGGGSGPPAPRSHPAPHRHTRPMILARPPVPPRHTRPMIPAPPPQPPRQTHPMTRPAPPPPPRQTRPRGKP